MTRLRLILILLLISIVSLAGLYVFFDNSDYLATPVKTFGSPLRVGDRVFLFTGQFKANLADLDDRLRSEESQLYVDLWAFDANTLAPLYRKRLQTERNGSMSGRSILGAQGDTVWLLLPKGLIAASLRSGDIIASTASIEYLNPPLRQLMPREESYFRFDENGLSFRAAEGRDWRIDPKSFLAKPVSDAPLLSPESKKEVIAPAYFTPDATYAFQERGLLIPGHWLGLLNQKDAQELRDTQQFQLLDHQSRLRLWAAKTGEGNNFFGKLTTYSDLNPIGEEYLAPGLLSDHRTQGRSIPLLLRNPDSVLILHLNRLGEEGRLQLARVAGPTGNTVWQTDLPLSVLQSLMPGDKTLLLFGILYTPPKDDRPRDPFHSARTILVSLNLSTGKVVVHDQSNVEGHPPAVPAADTNSR